MAWQAPSGCKVVRTSYTTRNPVMSYSYLKWCTLKWNSPLVQKLIGDARAEIALNFGI
jgi:hypothetical protein